MASLLTIEEWTALGLSLRVAACAALAGLPFAVAAGYVLARGRFRGKWLVETVLNLPLVLPPVVVGYLLLLAFAPRGPLGAALADWFGVRIVFTWLGAALASAVMSFPLAVRSMRLAFQGVDPRLEMAARSLGEFGATIMVAGNIEGQTRTIPLAIYSLAERPDGVAQVWRLVGLSILLACAALAASEWMERKATDGPA